jgi:hypothetical protein
MIAGSWRRMAPSRAMPNLASVGDQPYKCISCGVVRATDSMPTIKKASNVAAVSGGLSMRPMM